MIYSVKVENRTFKEGTYLLFIKTQFVPRSTHSLPRLYRTSPLMLYKAKVAVGSQLRTIHIDAMRTPCKPKGVVLNND